MEALGWVTSLNWNSSLMNRFSLIMAREEDPEFRKFCAWLFSYTAVQVFSTEEINSHQLQWRRKSWSLRNLVFGCLILGAMEFS